MKAPDIGSVLAVVLSPARLAVTSHKPSKINSRNSGLEKDVMGFLFLMTK